MTVIETLTAIFGFVGGLGLFLYGMNLLSSGLQKAAGNRMKNLLNAVTSKRAMGVLVGAAITAIIQSSGATTVMVVGFVNAGILDLIQAVGVIMGANIGTTITAWIVSLDSLGNAAAALKPTFYAPLLIGIGAALIMFCKKRTKKTMGEIVIAIGLLFVGLSTMSLSMSPYMQSEAVQNVFLTIGSNPLIGILIGLVVTAIMQSSSASVGVLQTMAGYGIVPASTAVFICLGADIGSCFTAILSSAGASRNAKRAAMVNLLFNVIGVAIWGTLLFVFFRIFPSFAAYIMSSVAIALFHSGFKLVNTGLFFPFANKLVLLSELMIPDRKGAAGKEAAQGGNDVPMIMDDRILNTPSLAIQAMNQYVAQLGEICLENVIRGLDAVMYAKYDLMETVYDTEKHIDNHVADLSDFLLKLSNDGLTDRQSMLVKDLMYTVIDMERIGDHAENLADLAEKMRDGDRQFSDSGLKDLERMRDALVGSLSNAVYARQTGNLVQVHNVFRYEDDVDALEEDLREKHMERLSKGECSFETGVIFLDVLTNLERISDHAVNIAGYVKDEA